MLRFRTSSHFRAYSRLRFGKRRGIALNGTRWITRGLPIYIYILITPRDVRSNGIRTESDTRAFLSLCFSLSSFFFVGAHVTRRRSYRFPLEDKKERGEYVAHLPLESSAVNLSVESLYYFPLFFVVDPVHLGESPRRSGTHGVSHGKGEGGGRREEEEEEKAFKFKRDPSLKF